MLLLLINDQLSSGCFVQLLTDLLLQRPSGCDRSPRNEKLKKGATERWADFLLLIFPLLESSSENGHLKPVSPLGSEQHGLQFWSSRAAAVVPREWRQASAIFQHVCGVLHAGKAPALGRLQSIRWRKLSCEYKQTCFYPSFSLHLFITIPPVRLL